MMAYLDRKLTRVTCQSSIETEENSYTTNPSPTGYMPKYAPSSTVTMEP